MSATVDAYLIDASSLGRVFGGNNHHLVEEIVTGFSESIQSNFINYRHEIDDGALTVIQALTDIVQGDITMPQFAWQYGNAIQLLCKSIGTKLPNDEFQMMQPGFFDAVEAQEIRVIPDMLFRHFNLPIPIPPIEDFPLITMITQDEAEYVLETTAEIEFHEPYAREKRELMEEFRGWLAESKVARQDIVTFYS